ncbi:hypothetical protein HY405_01130 [Candidatus Microgenomates bacterium]|nr:hypothetical protein [Candidatus Microgenomates bacterium]
MNTTLAVRSIDESVAKLSVSEESLILPSNERERLNQKLNKFKIHGLNARAQNELRMFTLETSRLFKELCWFKLGLSGNQLSQLDEQNLLELAKVIYEKSIIPGLAEATFLACVPVVGWLPLLICIHPKEMPNNGDYVCYKNLRYFLWYRKIRNKYGQIFKPEL